MALRMVSRVVGFACLWTLGLLGGLMVVMPGWAETPAPRTAPKQQKHQGFQFPPIQVPYLQAKANQKQASKGVYQFKNLIGKKPFVMFYFLPTHKPSLTELQALATAAKLLGDRVQFFGVTKAANETEANAAAKAVQEINVHLPILLDEKGLMAYVMLTQRVPAYALVTGSGRFTLARASALTEKVDETSSMLQMISRVAQGEETPFVIAPGYSPNPFDLIGTAAKNFKAQDSLHSTQIHFAEYLKQVQKPVLLAFWSITCPHCHKTMPILHRYAEQQKNRLRLLTMAVIHKPEYKKMLQEYFKEQKVEFPVLNDPKGETFDQYRIMTVPTLYLIDRTGTIRHVLLGGGKDVDQVVERFLRNLELPNPGNRSSTNGVSTRTTPPTSRPSQSNK